MLILDSQGDCDLMAEHANAVHTIVCRVCGRQLGAGRADVCWTMWMMHEPDQLLHAHHAPEDEREP